jgi:hypothetical protein
MRSHLPALAVLTILTVLGACSDSTDPTDDCPTDVAITVSAGTKPQFSWSPSCRAYQVGVNASTGPVWAMGFNFSNPAKANAIVSPVSFGDSLAIGDSLVAHPVDELTPGQTYTFYVFGLTKVGQSVKMGQQTFTP